MGKLKAVIFDIDGTLTPLNSWLAFTKGLGGSVDDHTGIYQDHLAGKMALDRAKAALVEMWQNAGKATKPSIEKLFAAWPIRQEAQGLVSQLQQDGYVLCLITGSFDLYAKYIANKLGVDNYFANARLIFDKANQLVDFDYTTDQAGLKLAQLKQFCSTKGLRLTECAAVGDDHNDIELFRATRHGILVSYNQAPAVLCQAAWRCVDDLSSVRDLLSQKNNH